MNPRAASKATRGNGAAATTDRGGRNGLASGRHVPAGRTTIVTYSWPEQPAPAPALPPVQLEHDRRNHKLRITTPDGRTAQFDDRPVRFLVMARDPKTKTLQPVLVGGEPLYYYLSPEVGSE
jgi:hypothetical protein